MLPLILLVLEIRYRRRFYCHTFNMGICCEQAKVDEPDLIDTIFTIIKTKIGVGAGLRTDNHG